MTLEKNHADDNLVYRLLFRISNSAHRTENCKVRAQLPVCAADIAPLQVS